MLLDEPSLSRVCRMTEEQVKATFEKLICLGESAQEYHYDMWFEASRSMLSEGEARKINSVRKLDLTDTFLVQILYKVYRCNMLVVFFWLRYCMLGLEMTQYRARLKAGAFHISAHSPCRDAPVGFSGTRIITACYPAK